MTDKPYHLLTPTIIGEEKTERDLSNHRFTAFAGSGFNPDSTWHRGTGGSIGPFPLGGDGLRYAIAIQQLRDAGRYDDATAAANIVRAFGWGVGTTKDRTVLEGFQPWRKGEKYPPNPRPF